MTDLMAQLAGADPASLLRDLRADEPVRAIELPSGAPAWLITRYEDARRALTDPRLSNRMGRGQFSGGADGGLTSEHMLGSDPPDHTRLRRLVSAGFTARRVERLEPRISQIAAELLDAMAGRSEVELIEAYAFPLPIQVICELLGVPVEDRDSFRTWSNAVVTGTGSPTPELMAAMGEMVGYIQALLERKRCEPADDLLSALLAGRDEQDALSGNELLSMVFLMLIAGHETTVNLIGNGVYLLLTNPDALARVRSDPALLPVAVEEFLRYESPVRTSSYRIATEPVEYSGVRIPAGSIVLISLMSANRDETQFIEADRFDLGRADGGHIAFGHGIHFCLGAALARLEGRIAIGALLQRYPGLELATAPADLQWRPGLHIRGLSRLPIRLTPA